MRAAGEGARNKEEEVVVVEGRTGEDEEGENEKQRVGWRRLCVDLAAGGLSRGVRKIVRRKKLPNLSKYSDISEYVMGGGASDSEPEDTEESKVGTRRREETKERS
eukprot:765345-Hanusia_phi.AAC.1